MAVDILHMDCMEYMAGLDDDAFDLVIADPPYGIEKAFNATSRIAKYGQVKTCNDWKPDADFFAEIKRISVNQIVWGYNHLAEFLGPTKEFIFWYKHQPVDTYSDGELAWTSFTKTAKCFDHAYFGAHGADIKRIHPVQKPVKLYKWLLSKYAKPDQRILDTHLGSGSSAIAAHYYGCDFVGMEIDKDYFDAATARFYRETRQTDMIGY